MERFPVFISRNIKYLFLAFLAILFIWGYMQRVPVLASVRGRVGDQEERIFFRVQLPSAKIASIHHGEKAWVRLDAYPYYRCGTLQGVIARKGDRPSGYDEEGNALYEALIRIDHIPDEVKGHIRAGMPGQADIEVRKERLLAHWLG